MKEKYKNFNSSLDLTAYSDPDNKYNPFYQMP